MASSARLASWLSLSPGMAPGGNGLQHKGPDCLLPLLAAALDANGLRERGNISLLHEEVWGDQGLLKRKNRDSGWAYMLKCLMMKAESKDTELSSGS